MTAADVPSVSVRIRRAEPGVRGVHWDAFRVPLEDRMTVLDALFAILRDQDRSLAFRSACRAAMCGSCAMLVNGHERLACKTPLAQVSQGARRPVRVEPLRNLPVIKDLVVDMDAFFEKYAAIEPRVLTRPDAQPEPAQIAADDPVRREIAAGLDCITCGACYSACPMVAADPDYLGPAQLLRAFNVLADEREEPLAKDLRGHVFGPHGIWRCHGIGECTRVCPKGLDPAEAVRRLKRSALMGWFG